MKYDSYINVMAMRDLTGLPVGVWTGFSPHHSGEEEEHHAYPALIFGNQALELSSDRRMRLRSGAHEDIGFDQHVSRIDLRLWPIGRIRDVFDPGGKREHEIDCAMEALLADRACGDFIRQHGALDLQEAVISQDFDAAKRHIEAGAFAHAYEFKPLLCAISAGKVDFIKWLLEHHKPAPILERTMDDAILKALLFAVSLLPLKTMQELCIAETLDAITQSHSIKRIPASLMMEAIKYDYPLILERVLRMMDRPLNEITDSQSARQVARLAIKKASELASDRCLEVLLEAGIEPGNNARAQAVVARDTIKQAIEDGVAKSNHAFISRKSDF